MPFFMRFLSSDIPNRATHLLCVPQEKPKFADTYILKDKAYEIHIMERQRTQSML